MTFKNYTDYTVTDVNGFIVTEKIKMICDFTVQRKFFCAFCNGEGWPLSQWLHPVDQNPPRLAKNGHLSLDLL